MSTNLAFVGICGLVLGMAFRMRWVAFAGAYLVSAAMLTWLYSRISVSHLTYSRRIIRTEETSRTVGPLRSGHPARDNTSPKEATEAFVGDTLCLEVTLENRKPVPVLWLRCNDEIPGKDELELKQARYHWKPNRAMLSNVTYLKWFERVERRFEMKCLSRGYLKFGPVSLTSGDPLGMRETATELPDVDSLVVYPRVMRVDIADTRREHPFGEAGGRGWLHPDPLEIAGVQRYTPDTPLRQISWKATARTGRLQAKALLPAFRRETVVALNLTTCEHPWEGIIKDSLEASVSAAASICFLLKSRGIAVGFATNAPGRPPDPCVYLRPGQSGGHLRRILRTLAGVYMPWVAFSDTLRFLPRKLRTGDGVIAVMSSSRPEDWHALLSMSSRGHPVSAVVIRADEVSSQYCQLIPTWAPRERIDWQAGEVIELVRLGREEDGTYRNVKRHAQAQLEATRMARSGS